MKTRPSIVFGFLALIAAGAAFFATSWATPAGQPGLSWQDALFTATSAVCITGLTVIDPGTQLSALGQGALAVLVEIGCIGFITLGTFFLVCTGQRLSATNEFSIQNAYGVKGVNGLKGLVVWVVLSMLAIEGLGTVAFRASTGAGWRESAFYAVMAFCNAGFSLAPDSLASFSGKPFALVTLACLILLGGFGFLVLYNLLTIRWWRRNLVTRGRPSLHARVVIYMSLALTAFTFLFLCAVEWREALAAVPNVPHRLAVAFFQAVTPRTCGFTVIPCEDFSDVTNFIQGLLMFTGAGPGGAGGGVKVTTVLVVLAVVVAICRGRRDVIISKRTIAASVIREAIVIFFVYGALVACAMTVLLLTESARGLLSFDALVFETVSAVSTTGLSLGDTTRLLSPAGRLVIMLCMFAGRLGAITIVMLLANRDEPASIRYPREELVVG